MENAEATMEGRGAVNALSYAEQSYPFRGPAVKHFCRFICRKTFSSHYFCSRCQILHIFSGIANRASAGCSKRNHRLSAEIIGFHKGVDNRRLSVPPYRKLNCRPVPLSLDFTRIDRIQKCVLRIHFSEV